MMRIDLHTHSWASDGTESPTDLVAAARAAGVDVVALTDHDTAAGWDEAKAEAQRDGRIVLVPGVEISCRREGTSLHLLGYRFDPDHPALAEELRRLRNDRVPRAQAIVRRMSAAGLPLTWEDVKACMVPEAVLGRPHLADAMIEKGMVGSREEAFARYLHRNSPYYVAHRALDPAVAVGLLRAAGGVAVLAHPARRGAVVSDQLVAELRDAGMAGMEVDHPDHDPAARDRLRALASDLSLLPTGSSDYHGTGKVNRLAEGTTDPEVYEALLAPATGSEAAGREVA